MNRGRSAKRGRGRGCTATCQNSDNIASSKSAAILFTFGHLSKSDNVSSKSAAIFGDFGHLSKSAKDINRSSTVFRAMPTASAISCCILDTCLNCNKIASSRVRVWERMLCQNSDNKSTVPPKGGLAAPLSGAIATHCPCPLGGGGGGRRPGGVGGLRSKVLHRNGG